MDVQTILIAPEVAKAKLDEYRSVLASQRTEEDERLHSLYKAVARGARVIDITQAFQRTGLNALSQPRLAIARADKKQVWFRGRQWLASGERGIVFDTSEETWFDSRRSRHYVVLPSDTFEPHKIPDRPLRSAVPHMPPGVRPQFKLENYHILFEVEKWEEYPVDPFLLRRIDGYLYVVEAEWELTPLEASLLASMRGGN